MILDFIKNFVFTIAGCAALLWATAYVICSALEIFMDIVNRISKITRTGQLFNDFLWNRDDFKKYVADREVWRKERERWSKNG